MTTAKNKVKVYIFHQDPGHGWLAVKRKELIDLGLADCISSYSYQKGKTVYLEEDRDAPLFIDILKKKGIEFHYRASHLEKTPIRSYASYSNISML